MRGERTLATNKKPNRRGTMRAYQVVEFNAPIVCNEIADPTPTGSQVVVDVITCGLCHSDAHFHEGHVSLGGAGNMLVAMLGINLPTSLGHEIFGRIAAFGPDSGYTQADVGNPVVVYPWIGCGECPACLAERDNECPTPQSLGMQRPGGHAEKLLVRDRKYSFQPRASAKTTQGSSPAAASPPTQRSRSFPAGTAG